MVVQAILLLIWIVQTCLAHDLTHLLKPQLGFEINLIIPDSSFYLSPSIPPALTQSIEYLVAQQVPFRLIYNSNGKIKPPQPSRSSRHAENQVAHLVFVTVQPKQRVVDLHEAFESCLFGDAVVASSTIPKHFIHVIITHTSALLGPLTSRFLKYRHRSPWLPLYLIVLHWSSAKQEFYKFDLFHDVRGCDGRPSKYPLKHMFPTINAHNGIQNFAKLIRSEKKDFCGKKLWFCRDDLEILARTGDSFSMLPFSLRKTHVDYGAAIGGLLYAFSTFHNFTFHTVDCGDYERVGLNVVRSSGGYNCVLPSYRCYIGPLILSHFDSYTTFYAAKPEQPDPMKLSSLVAPLVVNLIGPILLLAVSCCMSLIFMKMRHKRKPSRTVLTVISGVAGDFVSPSRNSWRFLLYVTWQFLLGFVSIGYTNVLQSILVVPSVSSSELKFEEMIRENFTFESVYSEFIKSRSLLMAFSYLSRSVEGERKFKIIEMEEQLAERVAQRRELNHSDVSSAMNEFSRDSKKALVVLKSEVERYGPLLLHSGWSVVVGKEAFFNSPRWWGFESVESGSLLADSLETLRLTGLLSYFLRLRDSKLGLIIAEVSDPRGGPDEPLGIGWRVALTDGLTSECMVLFLYGVLVAAVGFFSEIVNSVTLLSCIYALHRIRVSLRLFVFCTKFHCQFAIWKAFNYTTKKTEQLCSILRKPRRDSTCLPKVEKISME